MLLGCPGNSHVGSSAAASAEVQLYFPSNSLSPREEYVFNWCDTSTRGVGLLICTESTEQLSCAIATCWGLIL